MPIHQRSDTSRPTVLEYDAIRRLLPHAAPFVLIDRVLLLEPGRRIECLKCVSGAEPVLACHFPDRALYPGALLLEAMAQAALILFLAGAAAPEGTPVLAAARARWLHPVRPGDQVRLTVSVEKQVRAAAILDAVATVGVARVAQARLSVGVARADS
jgi:3-hydroxyacyl-[acyl-carrier-protein] dehydratase